MAGWKRNDANGQMPKHDQRVEGWAICKRCSTRVLWVRLAQSRIPYEGDDLGGWIAWTDHRTLCRLRLRGAYQTLGPSQYRFATVRHPSARLLAATGRAGRRPRPWKAMKARSSRDESVAHVPATQAAGQTTGRAGAQATAPSSFQGTDR